MAKSKKSKKHSSKRRKCGVGSLRNHAQYNMKTSDGTKKVCLKKVCTHGFKKRKFHYPRPKSGRCGNVMRHINKEAQKELREMRSKRH